MSFRGLLGATYANELYVTGNPAFRQGLLFGILLGLFSIGINVILRLAVHTGVDSLLSIVGIIGAILASLLAGKRASQQTGRVGTGALAGLWTGLISTVITEVYTWVYLLVFSARSPTTGEQSTVSYAPSLVDLVLSTMLVIALAMLFGAAIGALGGLLRKR